jgi:hypothetical protein
MFEYIIFSLSNYIIGIFTSMVIGAVYAQGYEEDTIHLRLEVKDFINYTFTIHLLLLTLFRLLILQPTAQEVPNYLIAGVIGTLLIRETIGSLSISVALAVQQIKGNNINGSDG